MTDLVVHRGDLVVATQGRGFWILDDITPLRHVEAGEPAGDLVLYPVRTFTDVAAEPGLNRFNWNLDYPPPRSGRVSARAVPGIYAVLIEEADGIPFVGTEFEVLMDPRLEEEITVADLQAQFDYLIRARDRLDALDDALEGLRQVRSDAGGAADRSEANDAIRDAAERANSALTGVEEVLVQPRGAGFANPSRIRSHLQFVMTAASSQRGEDLDARPTEQLLERLVDLETELEGALTRLRGVYAGEVAELNAELESAELEPIQVPAVPGRRAVS